MGISEHDFWSMTLAELQRAIASRKRVMKIEAQEKASFDYILADLVGRSIGRLYSSSAKLPEIAQVYPALFDGEDLQAKKAEQQAQLSALRFKQFAETHNKKYGGAKDN